MKKAPFNTDATESKSLAVKGEWEKLFSSAFAPAHPDARTMRELCDHFGSGRFVMARTIKKLIISGAVEVLKDWRTSPSGQWRQVAVYFIKKDGSKK